MKALLEPEKLFKLLMWGVALLFAWFLVGFGGLLIRDLPHAGTSITLEQFATPAMQALKTRKDSLEQQQATLNDQRDVLQQTLSTATSTYDDAHSSFDTWIATRNATQSSAQNPELIKRTRDLEALKAKGHSVNSQIQALDSKLLALTQESDGISQQLSDLETQSTARYEHAQFAQDIKIFAWRLLFVLPLLILAAWLFMRQRRSKYWPFVWGFILFALFTFFVELVPYLPSYGGYVRYVVGLVVVCVVGRYGIDWMQGYIARRKQDEQATENIRRQKLDNTLAIKKIGALICPSCERHTPESKDVVTNFCMHCGLTLYKACAHCNTRHNAFFLHCPTCGVRGDDLSP